MVFNPMSLNLVHLIRHGQSEANLKGLVCGQLDSPLTEFARGAVENTSGGSLIHEIRHQLLRGGNNHRESLNKE